MPSGAAAKIAESQRLTLIFVDPGSHERTVGGSGLERFDQIAELHPTLLHPRKSGVLVSRMTDRYSGSLLPARSSQIFWK